jgi:DNA-binding response OmpR family regulator
VEDDRLVADSVNVTLHDEGWSVETCSNGAAALAKLESGERFDIVIFDNKLPDTTGIELTKRTRALAHRKQTPIIMLSSDKIELEARRAGANSFLRKPEDVSLIA